MKHLASLVRILILGTLLLTACGAPTTAPAPVIVKETVPVIQTVAVQQTVQVKETVQVPVKETVQVVVTPTPEPTQAPKKGGTMIAAWATDAKGLDPHTATNFTAFRVLELEYDTLLGFDKDLKVIPDLAESWSWSTDNLALTLKLRQNVKFHSGNPLTSEDVKFSINRILDEKTAAAARSYFTGITQIDTPDANTIVLHLKEPQVTLLAAMTNPNSAIVDMKAVTNGADPAKDDVGSGPFKMSSWTPNEKLVLVANKDYWMPGLPYLDGIEFRVIPDESSILAALRTKQVDWAVIADPHIAIAATAAKNSGLVIDRATSLSYNVMQLNASRPIFKDIRVRQALSCAIDRQQVLDVASLGEGQVIGPVTPPFYQPPLSDLPCYTPDLAKAKQLLKEAGAENLQFSIMATNEEIPLTVAQAQNIQAQLSQIGVKVTIDTVELGVFVDRWFKGTFDAVTTENGGNPDPDVMLYRYWHSTGNLQTVSQFSTPAIDTLLTQARQTYDVAARKAIYADISKQLVDAAPWIWLYVGNQYRVMQPYVMGYTSMANGSAVFLRETWLNK
jgi:peptide/nickel transport system substrate-binding protein